jgi:hypothetical protein
MEADPRGSCHKRLYDPRVAESLEPPEFHLLDGFASERVQQTRRWIAAIRRAADANIRIDSPFLVLTPLGMPMRDAIASWLVENGYTVVRRIPIPDWPGTAASIYPRALDDERLIVALAFEALWRSNFPRPDGEQWQLGDAGQIQRLNVEKHILRARCGLRRFKVLTPTVTFRASLQALHVPDPDRYLQEAAILASALSQNSPNRF